MNNFKKENLRNGMIVRLKNNEMYIVLNGGLSNMSDFVNVCCYDDELTHKSYEYDIYDIIEVYEIAIRTSLNNVFDLSKLVSIWKRKTE